MLQKFEENENMINWINGVFKKVVCLAREIEWNKLKNETNFIVLTESSLDNIEISLAFCPRKEYSKKIKSLKMGTPQNI